MPVHGILNLLKPPGCTSMDVVRLVKRLTREKGVGHGGTLDPIATGVLPICFGQATRFMEYLIEGTKVYRAEVALGITTDTYDATGATLMQRDPAGVAREAVERALADFTGLIYQTPPMYSALKRGGERLYNLARAGVEVPRAPRKVQVSRLELLEWRPPAFVILVECGRGVYIRSLAHDIGEALGCGAHLTSLERVRSGPFELRDAVSLSELEAAVQARKWQSYLCSPDTVLLPIRAAFVGKALENQIKQGRPVSLGRRTLPSPSLLHRDLCRIYSSDGRFLALARYEAVKRLWQPEKVFDLSSPPE